MHGWVTQVSPVYSGVTFRHVPAHSLSRSLVFLAICSYREYIQLVYFYGSENPNDCYRRHATQHTSHDLSLPVTTRQLRPNPCPSTLPLEGALRSSST